MIYQIMQRVGIAALGFCVAALLVFWLAGPLPQGSDGPLAAFVWFGRGLAGDFGVSTARAAPAGGLVLQSLAVTLPLLVASALLATAIGVGIAVLALRLDGTRGARVLEIVSALLSMMPAFWLGLLLLLVFAVGLRWLPAGGFFAWNENPAGAIASLLLPILSLALPFGSALGRIATETLLEVRQSLPVTSALLRGQSLRSALVPQGIRLTLLMTLSAARSLLPTLFGATLIVETAFYLPGLGRLIADGIIAADPYLARAGLFAAAMLATLLVLAVDVGRDVADPRHTVGDAP